MRPLGPEMEIAAITWPEALRIGAEIEHTPSSRSLIDSAQPRLRTAASFADEKRAWRKPWCRRSESSHASRICAAEPASIDSMAPTGIESRSPLARSTAAMHTRCSPWRR